MIKQLVTVADINNIKKITWEQRLLTAQEAALLQEYTAFSVKIRNSKGQLRCDYESKLQIAAHNLIKTEFQYRKDVDVIFLQIDNGGNKGTNHKRKAQEGTQAGWADVEIKAWKKEDKSWVGKSFYVETKKIGGVVARNQQHWHDFLIEKGESAYFYNNLLYFEKVIIKEIKEFLKY